jgi:hypothetical protein
MDAHAHTAWVRNRTIGRIAAILLGIGGVVGVVAGLPKSTDSGPMVSISDGPRAKTARVKCPECGVVASTREIDWVLRDRGVASAESATGGKMDNVAMASVKHYEVTVRMKDGSIRVFTDLSPSRWRAGERVILIESVDRSGN